MTITHRVARSVIAPLFISGGLDSVQHPEEKAKLADPVLARIGAGLGLNDADPVSLVRFNGGVQLAAGTCLMLGWAPRLSSMVLTASLVPTTVAGHRYWEESDPKLRAQQKVELLKNLAILGGLVLAATDTNGAPSLRWRAALAARTAHKKAAHAASHAVHAAGNAADALSLGSLSLSSLSHGKRGRHAKSIGRRAMKAASITGTRALAAGQIAGRVGKEQTVKVAERAADHASTVAEHASHLGSTLSEHATNFAEHASHAAAQLGATLSDRATDFADQFARKVA